MGFDQVLFFSTYLFLTSDAFWKHNSEASNNWPFPLSIFTFTHLYSSHSSAQYAVSSFSPTQRVCTSTLHWFHFSAQLLAIAGGEGHARMRKVCVRGVGARMGKLWGECGMWEDIECICAFPCLGIRVAGQWGKSIGSLVTSIRVVLSAGEPAGSIGNCVKGRNRAGSRRSPWSLQILKVQYYKVQWIACYSSWKWDGAYTPLSSTAKMSRES